MTTKKVVAETDVPTYGQGRLFVKQAREKGVPRSLLQRAFDDSTVAHFLVAIKNGYPIAIGTPLIPPRGGRIYTLHVSYDKGRPWQEAINAAAPGTPADSGVRRAANEHPPQAGKKEDEVILLHFPRRGSWDKAIAWASQVGLGRSDPRAVFAISEQHPNLSQELGLDPMYLIATKEWYFGGKYWICLVSWNGSEHQADLDDTEDLYYGEDLWFVFCRPPVMLEG